MVKFFRKPWFWILLLDVLYLLIAVFFALSFALFPDAAYSDWEEFYITKWRDSAIRPLYSLFTFLISLACCIITPFLRKTAVRAKAASMFIYLLLALFSLGFLMPDFLRQQPQTDPDMPRTVCGRFRRLSAAGPADSFRVGVSVGCGNLPVSEQTGTKHGFLRLPLLRSKPQD